MENALYHFSSEISSYEIKKIERIIYDLKNYGNNKIDKVKKNKLQLYQSSRRHSLIDVMTTQR